MEWAPIRYVTNCCRIVRDMISPIAVVPRSATRPPRLRKRRSLELVGDVARRPVLGHNHGFESGEATVLADPAPGFGGALRVIKRLATVDHLALDTLPHVHRVRSIPGRRPEKPRFGTRRSTVADVEVVSVSR